MIYSLLHHCMFPDRKLPVQHPLSITDQKEGETQDKFVDGRRVDRISLQGGRLKFPCAFLNIFVPQGWWGKAAAHAAAPHGYTPGRW